MPLRLRLAGRTDVGRVRRRNEDSFVVEPERGLALVADGMGGHPGGDVASAVAADHAAATLRVEAERLEGDAEAGTLEALAARAVLDAHRGVREEGARRPDLEGMGTTLTALLLAPGGETWVLGHAGDSRAYLLRDGELRRLTRDDTWLQSQVEAGRVAVEDAHKHPAGHVLEQCVGLATPPEPRTRSGRVRNGDRFLLCTDGLTDMLSDDEIRALLAGARDPEEAVESLVRQALEEGGVDNVTAVVADVVEEVAGG